MANELAITMFQEGHSYDDAIHIDADRVMVYGLNESLPNRIDSWREQGYQVAVMLGLAWGSYSDYLQGRWDGVHHGDTDVQVAQDGKKVLHGNSKEVAYLVPTLSFHTYLIERLLAIVDCGVDEFYFEEPEFWADSGYSEAFQTAWQQHYNTRWQAQHTSMEAQRKAAKLKLDLYLDLFVDVAKAIKEYGSLYGREIRCIVATHSLINYAQWRLVSPVSAFLGSEYCDGFIGQVWTGTSRTPNMLRGQRATRTFYTAFLEYGFFESLVAGGKRALWALHDPIEDNPDYSWPDYRYHYLRTVVASLLRPAITKFEICPWPWRVFCGIYKEQTIPENYHLEIRTMFDALRRMGSLEGERMTPVIEVGLLVDDSALFQRPLAEYAVKYDGTRHDGDYDEETKKTVCWNEFFGLPMPLLEDGLVVTPVPFQSIALHPENLQRYKVLILSYQFMKPLRPDYHRILADWVNEGGTLLYVGDGRDPFQQIREWWNGNGAVEKSAIGHLKDILGCDKVDRDAENAWRIGCGRFEEWNIDPGAIALDPNLADAWIKKVRLALDAPSVQSGVWLVRRGSYIAGMRLRETEDEIRHTGQYVDLTRHDLPVLTDPILSVDEPVVWHDLSDVSDGHVIASSVMFFLEEVGATQLIYRVEASRGMPGSARIRLRVRPSSVALVNASVTQVMNWEWDDISRTVYIRFICGESDHLDIRFNG